MGVGVGRHDRRGGVPRHVPEALLVEVGDVDHDLQLVAALDQRLSRFGKARPRVGRGGEAEGHARGEHIVPAPHDAE